LRRIHGDSLDIARVGTLIGGVELRNLADDDLCA